MVYLYMYKKRPDHGINPALHVATPQALRVTPWALASASNIRCHASADPRSEYAGRVS